VFRSQVFPDVSTRGLVLHSQAPASIAFGILAMSVEVLNHKDVLLFLETSSTAESPVTKNFFDVFGTTACLLNCKNERTLDADLYTEKAKHAAKTRQEKKKITFERKIQIGQFRESRKVWFSVDTIAASAEHGCNSCKLLLKMLIAIFFQNLGSLPKEYEYSIAQDFELRYRCLGEEKPIAIAQLFQPPGSASTSLTFLR
jgi:hypothetical protein